MTTITTRTESVRQSDRIAFRMPLEASWLDSGGVVTRQMAQTLLISRNGGVIRIAEKLLQGQELTLKRQLEGDQIKSTRARVVAEIDQEPEGFLYAIHILDLRSDFWDIEFPSPAKPNEALARMLMECSFCQRREVVYLNEFELKSFEIRNRSKSALCRAAIAPASKPASLLVFAGVVFKKRSRSAKTYLKAVSPSAAAMNIPKARVSRSPNPTRDSCSRRSSQHGRHGVRPDGAHCEASPKVPPR